MFLSKKCFRQSLLCFSFKSCLNYSVNSEWPSPYFSQIPSQPIKSSSSDPVRGVSIMSGMHVMGCLLNGIPSIFLWLKSPIERVRFSPFTRPWIILTPAFSILSFYCGFYGLWSKDRGIHLSFCQRAALESPAFAHTILSFVIATTTAVAPAFSSASVAGLLSSSLLYLISS